MQTLAASKPAVVRVKIFALKKAELIDLCKAYSLDPSGTKEQIQERLLSYLHDLESEEQPETEPEEEPEPHAESEPVPTEVAEPFKEEPTEKAAEVSAAAPAVAAQTATIVQLEEPKPEPGPEPEPAPGSVPIVVETPVAETVQAPRFAPKAEHPCPTCGRELTFIAQYGRDYCYYCQRYAPAVRSKNACPTCGATMRWIDQHQRWWCDSCQKYASADLPKPVTAAVPVAQAAPAGAAAPTVARPAITLHRHASPAAGIGLVGLGLTLWVIVEFFAVLAPAMNLVIQNPFTAQTGALVTFFSVLFVAAGSMIGLSSLRDRP